ncbi:hypothetical protein VTI74DRAFT_8444 [Chaetomium olivicolor]
MPLFDRLSSRNYSSGRKQGGTEGNRRVRGLSCDPSRSGGATRNPTDEPAGTRWALPWRRGKRRDPGFVRLSRLFQETKSTAFAHRAPVCDSASPLILFSFLATDLGCHRRRASLAAFLTPTQFSRRPHSAFFIIGNALTPVTTPSYPVQQKTARA